MRNSLTLLSLLALALGAQAQTIAPEFAGSYSIADLGEVPGVTIYYGGMTLKSGDPNTLLIGGAADGPDGVISSIGVARTLVDGKMRISSFSGSASQYAVAPYIDGGLAYAPNGTLLFTGWPVNTMGQIKPGSTAPDRVTDLDPSLNSVGSIIFSPSGRLKITSYNQSTWSDLDYSDDGDGLYTFGAPSNTVQLSGGSEGAIYVPGGSALFAHPALLVAEYDTGNVAAYDIDANDDPIVSTRRLIVSGLDGADGAYLDPTTGDVLLSTYGGNTGNNRVVAIRGFAAVPEPASLAALGLGALGLLRRRRQA